MLPDCLSVTVRNKEPLAFRYVILCSNTRWKQGPAWNYPHRKRVFATVLGLQLLMTVLRVFVSGGRSPGTFWHWRFKNKIGGMLTANLTHGGMWWVSFLQAYNPFFPEWVVQSAP